MRSRQKVKIVGKIMVHAVILTIAIVIMILAHEVAAEATTEAIDLTIRTGVENAVAIEATTTEGTTRKISAEINSNRTGISRMVVISMRTIERARHQTRCIRSVRAITVAIEKDTIPITETSVEVLEASIAEDVASSEAEAIVTASLISEVAVVDSQLDPIETGKKLR